ncbi:hypothetical protein PanWU01x14_180610 [Parasponia andersonii]|uniref:Uncharacterized protein n=1 Tax=Parasponia andersonii TaxID=3476 RepID=A0A2P5C631_PARAD|nr:hypothetical protein PanWU01x14_180610 [Parasponia andersonii]
MASSSSSSSSRSLLESSVPVIARGPGSRFQGRGSRTNSSELICQVCGRAGDTALWLVLRLSMILCGVICTSNSDMPPSSPGSPQDIVLMLFQKL